MVPGVKKVPFNLASIGFRTASQFVALPLSPYGLHLLAGQTRPPLRSVRVFPATFSAWEQLCFSPCTPIFPHPITDHNIHYCCKLTVVLLVPELVHEPRSAVQFSLLRCAALTLARSFFCSAFALISSSSASLSAIALSNKST